MNFTYFIYDPINKASPYSKTTSSIAEFTTLPFEFKDIINFIKELFCIIYKNWEEIWKFQWNY